jgi:hypothetical protein
VSEQERIAELAAEQARLWEDNQRLRAEHRAVEHYEQRVRDIESSFSWRVTRPLRDVKTLAILVRRRLRPDD